MAEKKQKKEDIEVWFVLIACSLSQFQTHTTSYQSKIADLQKKMADASLDDETKAKLKV
jgi:hypothetical protein